MNYKHILALDPSGNFDEGKGTTGWVLMNYKEKLIASGAISARDFATQEEYWNEIIQLIKRNHLKFKEGLIVVVEDYVLYRDKAVSQTNSRMETSRLLGIIQYHCWVHNIACTFQLATTVKQRWSDELLLRERILYKDRDGLHHTETGYYMNIPHILDAFRHATHYCLCRNQEKNVIPRYTRTRKSFDNYTGGTTYDNESRNQNRQRKSTTNINTNRNNTKYRTRTRVWRAEI